MDYKVLFSEPTIGGEITSVKFLSIGQTIERHGYIVRLDKVLYEPTESRTGTALITLINQFGKVLSQTASIAKKA